jgi:Glycine zipper
MAIKILPAVIALVCFSAGIAIGALNNHLSQGAFVGAGVGFFVGLAILLYMRKRPRA